MRKYFSLFVVALVATVLITQCKGKTPEAPLVAGAVTFGGYESQMEWGNHIVTVSGCNDCHTPKKMGPHGPELDSAHLLAGHLEGSPQPGIIKEASAKGLVYTNDLTTWVGPWGTSYTANLTSDETGIGNWTEGQFIYAIREGKYKGLPNSRNLLPPMPWQMFRNFRDEELKAIFAYLKTTTPVKNVVPPPLLPAGK